MRRAFVVVGVVLVVAGCGDFFPNPDDVVLPSLARDYELDCGTIPRAECERNAARIVVENSDQPGRRVVKLELRARGGYTITFSDGNIEQLVVD